VLSSVPAADEPNKPLAVAKVYLLTLIALGAGVVFYAVRRRARYAAPAIAPSDGT
jgi:hypothetical protein